MTLVGPEPMVIRGDIIPIELYITRFFHLQGV